MAQMNGNRIRKESKMEKEKLLSVIVPVYNVEAYLEECVDSLLKQSYLNTEILLIDDGSVDKSGKICDACALKDDRVKVIHKENAGVSEARNAGLQAATGAYIAFADSDDLVEKTIYTELIGIMEQNGTDCACCSYEAFAEGRAPQKTIGSHNAEEGTVAGDSVFASGQASTGGNSTDEDAEGASGAWDEVQTCCGTEAFKVFLRENEYAPAVWNKVFRREALTASDGLLRFEANLTVGEDEKWLAEIFCGRDTSVSFLAKPLYHWRRRDDSASHKEKQGITKQNLDCIRVQEEIMENTKTLQDAELEELLKWRLYLSVLEVVKKCYKRRDTENFRRYYSDLKKVGTVRAFGEPKTEKLKRMVWSALFMLRGW